MDCRFIEGQKNIPKLTYSYHISSHSLRKLSTQEKSIGDQVSNITPYQSKLKNILLQKKSYNLTHRSPAKHPLTEKLQKNQNFLSLNLTNLSQRYNENHLRKSKKEKKIQSIIQSQKKYTKEEKENWFIENKKYYPFFFRQTAQISERLFIGLKSRNDEVIQNCALHFQSSKCLDGCFPMARSNSCLVFSDDKSYGLYLIGGLSPQIGHRLHFHRFDALTKLWIPIESEDKNAPRFNLSQHCAVSYKKMIYIVGGISIFPSAQEINKNQRYNIPFISIFNLEKNEWGRINWNIYLRAHACCSFGHYLLIDGGINEYYKHNSKTYVMDFDLNLAPIQLPQTNLKLAFHKIVSTDQVHSSIKGNLKNEGVFCFGGKYKDGTVNSELFFCELDARLHEKMKRLEWKSINTVGKGPQGRFSHSMNILNIKSLSFEKRAYILVIGGRNSKNSILNDAWAYDLFLSQWNEIILPENSSFVAGGISEHTAAASTKNTVFIFGGSNKYLNAVSEFWSLNFCKKSRMGKFLVRKYRSSNKQNASSRHLEYSLENE